MSQTSSPMVAKVFNCQNAASGTVFRWWSLGNSQFLNVQLKRKLTRITCRRKTIVRTVDIGDRTINLIPGSRKGSKEKISSTFDKNYFTNVSCVFADLRTHCSAAKLRKRVLRALSRVPSYQTKVTINLRGFPLSKCKKRVAVTGFQKISGILEITSGFREDSKAIVQTSRVVTRFLFCVEEMSTINACRSVSESAHNLICNGTCTIIICK